MSEDVSLARGLAGRAGLRDRGHVSRTCRGTEGWRALLPGVAALQLLWGMTKNVLIALAPVSVLRPRCAVIDATFSSAYGAQEPRAQPKERHAVGAHGINASPSPETKRPREMS